MSSETIDFGKAKLRFQPEKDGSFAGVVIRDGKMSEIFREGDRNAIIARLKSEAGKLEPNYFGMDEAIKRFLEFMPDGFDGERNDEMEDAYKRNAAKALSDAVSSSNALSATPDDAAAVHTAKVWTNLLSPYEAMKLKDTLAGDDGAKFLQGAAQFCDGGYAKGATLMAAAMTKGDRLTWPIATYFSYLWSPDTRMFLKPEATRDFAERIGHPFVGEYESAINEGTYQSLLDLADQTLTALKPIGAKDYIDVQSFIWVVGAYRDEHLPE